MSSGEDTYRTIFKSTFLFGFVQVFNILVKVGLNKAVAVFLGTGGMGMISLFQSTINILKTGFELGISQSAVRDISLGMSVSPKQGAGMIATTQRIFLFTSLAGGAATLVLSPRLSQWTFGNDAYTYAFMWLSLVVSLTILSEGQLGILKGLRQLRALAKASLFGSVVGLVTGVPLYYFFGEGGIVPSLIVAALTAALFSAIYVHKANVNKEQVTTRQAFTQGKKMIQMGVAMMYVNFLVVVSEYVIRIYVGRMADIQMVGLYQAGSMVVTAYFGVVLTALTTDYYPRISAVCNDNVKISEEFNKQSEVGLIVVAPLLVVFMFAQHFFVDFLYTPDFVPIIGFLEYATFGVLLTICSNSLGFILLAKQESKVFFFTATVGRAVVVLVGLLFFRWWGLVGLGIASVVTSLFHLLFMQAVLWWRHKIRMEKNLLGLLGVCLMLTGIAFFLKDIENPWMKYVSGILLVAAAAWYSFRRLEQVMGISVLSLLMKKLKK